MLKPLAMVLVFLLCTMLGVRHAGQLRRQVKLLSALQNDIKRLMMCMEFERKPLAVLLSERAQGELRPLWQVFSEELMHGMTPSAAIRTALDAADAEIAGFSMIDSETRTMLAAFSSALGSTELDGQRQNASMLLAGLQPKLEQANAECSAKEHIFRTVGMLSGAAAVILML